MSVKAVPFSNLNAQHLSIKSELELSIRQVIESSSFIRGPFVESFEREFASLTSSKYCLSCANGTDSLFIAMKCLDVGPGDEVIVPAHTWISTSETVTLTGAKVVFADINLASNTIDPDSIISKITPKTVGIIPVHLYGHPAEMSRICQIADRHNLWIIEDCAQSHLATYNGLNVGSFGVAASYSFYPGKNLGAMGDAGAITTNSSELIEKMCMFARHGGKIKGEHLIEGMNSRMDGLQAAILSIKLKYLPLWTQQRQVLASEYLSRLASLSQVSVPQVSSEITHSWHLFVIRTFERDMLREYLSRQNISTSINYPISLPFLPAYAYLSHQPHHFPSAYDLQNHGLAIPLYPEMSIDDQNYVIDNLLAFFD